MGQDTDRGVYTYFVLRYGITTTGINELLFTTKCSSAPQRHAARWFDVTSRNYYDSMYKVI